MQVSGIHHQSRLVLGLSLLLLFPRLRCPGRTCQELNILWPWWWSWVIHSWYVFGRKVEKIWCLWCSHEQVFIYNPPLPMYQVSLDEPFSPSSSIHVASQAICSWLCCGVITYTFIIYIQHCYAEHQVLFLRHQIVSCHYW